MCFSVSIVKRIKRAKLFTFLRQHRHQLFDEEFQEELSKLYANSSKGHSPVPPAQLALAIILQAYTGASDAEAIEALTMDRRWQLVLNCIDCENAPFSQATLARFRTALIKRHVLRDLDNGLVQTVGITRANVPEASAVPPLFIIFMSLLKFLPALLSSLLLHPDY